MVCGGLRYFDGATFFYGVGSGTWCRRGSMTNNKNLKQHKTLLPCFCVCACVFFSLNVRFSDLKHYVDLLCVVC